MATIENYPKYEPNNRSPAFKPTPHEVEAVGKALKDPNFRAMLVDYVQEVNENQDLYKEEVRRFEAQNGFNVTFLQPQPGYVIKTRVLSSTEAAEEADVEVPTGKVFINVCSDENVGDAKASEADHKGRIPWAVPYSTSKPRRDVDKAGEQCIVYDVLFHPNVITKTTQDFMFRKLVNTTALEGVENAFNLKLDRHRLRFPKMKFKGSPRLTIVRKPMTEAEKAAYKIEPAPSEKLEKLEEKPEPKYELKYRYLQSLNPEDLNRPSELVINISLPEMVSAKEIDLDVLEHLLTLESLKHKLVLKLPYPVHEDQGEAKFDKAKHNLAVTLPVKAKEPVERLVSVDSGIGLEFDEEHEKTCETLEAVIKPEPNEAKALVRSDASLPPYTCNIYEGLMVLTINVRNVKVDSLAKAVLKDEKGYQLTFHTLGQGFVPFHYGFCLAFDFNDGAGTCHLDDLEIEIWDNNMILQLSMPKNGCTGYQVGMCEEDLGDILPLPRLEAVKEKCFLKKKSQNQTKENEDLDSDDSIELKSEEKERHSSGESNDSAVCFSTPTSPIKSESPNRFLVIPSDFGASAKERSNLRSILRRTRGYSETNVDFLRMTSPLSESESSTIAEEEDEVKREKKSVRFNEVVQRQIYRSNSSILGQKMKNQKKNQQKRRKQAARRASEGDTPTGSITEFRNTDNAGSDACSLTDSETIDSGVASSMDESHDSSKMNETEKQKSNNKKKNKSKQSKQKLHQEIHNQHSDLIFNLDI